MPKRTVYDNESDFTDDEPDNDKSDYASETDSQNDEEDIDSDSESEIDPWQNCY